MPIKSFRLENVGPIKKAEANDLASVMIAGPNGVGKSTLLENIKRQMGNASVVGSGKILYIPPYRAPLSFQLHRALPFIGPRTRYTDVLALDSFNFPSSVSGIHISMPPYFTSSNLRSRSTPDFAPYFQVKYKLVQLQHEFERILAEAFKRFEGEIPKGTMPVDIYLPLRELVRMILPGIQFSHVYLEGEEYKIYFRARTNDLVEFDALSSGEKDVIAMLFPFIEKKIENELARVSGRSTPNEDLIILIDTPEANLHPTLQRNFLEYMRSSVEEAKVRGEQLQFIVVTHSTVMINWAKPDELYFMLFPDQSPDGNQITKVATDSDKIRFIKDILGDVGLASLVTGKPVLLLEGENDPEILKLLLPEVGEKFTLLPLGGKGRILNFIGAFEKVLVELASRGFKIFVVLDKDTGSKDSESSFCFIWPRTCIENFLLLDSQAIYQALRVLIGDEKLQEMNVRSEDDIEHLIDSIIKDPEVAREEIKKRTGEQMKFYLGDDWVDIEDLKKKAYAQLKKKISRIENQYDIIQKLVNEVVEHRDSALVELNGKLILGKLASKFNVKREALARAIADKLSEKTPQEIKDFIVAIEVKCQTN